MNCAIVPVIVPAALIWQLKLAIKPRGLELMVQGPPVARAAKAAVVVTVTVVPAGALATLVVMAGAAHARGRLPSDGRFKGGIVIFGILTCVNGNGLIVNSGIWMEGLLRFGRGTNNPVVTKSIRYTRLARRVVKPPFLRVS